MNAEEVRKWYVTGAITLLVLTLVLTPLVVYHNYEVNKLNAENGVLSKKIQTLVDQYQKPPIVITRYIKVPITTTSVETITQPVYVTPPTDIEGSFKTWCDLSHGKGIEPETTASNGAISCTIYPCLNKGKISLLQAGIHDIQKESEQSVFRLSGVAGYDGFHSLFTLGVSFLDWHDLIAGINMGFNFKSILDTDGGAFIGYRPQLWGREINASIFAGPTYGVKGWGVESGLQFHFYN